VRTTGDVARAAHLGCAVVAGPVDHRGGHAVHFAAADHTVEGFEKFILWTHRQRVQGAFVCFAVVPEGYEDAVGLFQVRQLEPGFGTAEWGFALGSPFWGTGIFPEAARLVVDFMFERIGARRLEARAAILNGRGNGALKKLGAVREGILRKSLFRHGLYLDQFLWTILDEDWRGARTGRQSRVH
jgi:RimJ/RimL family protein N-acetyltransferase